MNAAQAVKNFERQFARIGNARQAAWDKNYMKSPLKFFGTRKVDQDIILKKFFVAHKDLAKPELWRLARALWQSDYHEIRTVRRSLLVHYRRLLDYADMPKLEKILYTAHDWGVVDEVAVHLVGYLLGQDQRVISYLKKWNTDKLFWLRRASILPWLFLIRQKEYDRRHFVPLLVNLMDESWQSWAYAVNNYDLKMRRFFIRKAIGWCLRELSEKFPDEVVRLLNKYKSKMHSLSWREGGRKLSVKYRKQLKV
ncbi:DNA alkylation repair protein [Candidatus Falkowbacteria bacterium]|nr:DNA alkylation repair protein [Candidatus Falkowbacteria bacterium]